MKKNPKIQLLSVFLLICLVAGLFCACKQEPGTELPGDTVGSTVSETPTDAPTGEQTFAPDPPEAPTQPGQPEHPVTPEQPVSNPWGISDGDVQTPKSKIYHN